MTVRRLLAFTGAAGIALAVAACSSGSSPAPTTTVVVTQTSVVTQAVTDPAPPPVTVTVTAASSPDAKATTSTKADTFTMPNVVGSVLQDAQDKLQTLGSYVMDQRDASGLDRIQVLDSNWKVCKQSPKKGKVVTVDTTVVLWSVKLDEKCP